MMSHKDPLDSLLAHGVSCENLRLELQMSTIYSKHISIIQPPHHFQKNKLASLAAII